MIKIAFVGIGSIAKRHIRNLAAFLTESGLTFTIDAYRSGMKKELEEDISRLVTAQYSVDGPVADVYDAVFVTNPTAKHYETLEKFAKYGKSFFIEKPAFTETSVSLDFLETVDKDKCYVACPLRYNPVIRYVKENIDLSKVISVRAISSSYLPDWRPGTDYRKCYSAHKELGGGVDIDLIHEWDYITHLFGRVNTGFSLAGKVSGLEIDSNDIAVYIAKTESTVVELHLDYFGRSARRTLTLFTDEDVIECDLLAGKITYLQSGKTVELESERNAFQMEEIRHFFEICTGNQKTDSSIEHAITVLKYAKGEF